MRAEQLSWVGWEVATHDATWVCTQSVSKDVGFTSPTTFMVDGIDYFLEFSARNKTSEAVPDSRRLQLRTSSFKISHEPSFLWHLSLVIDGQMLEGAPWDRFKEVYKQD